MTWGAALHWIDAMNVANYLGASDWRLPKMLDVGDDGCNFAFYGTDCGYNVLTGSAATTIYSELASLWHDSLGNVAYFDATGNGPQAGWDVTDTGPFNDVQNFYWFGTGYGVGTASIWTFRTDYGAQGLANNDNGGYYAWAVRSGDIAAVPVPGAMWPMSTALVGLLSGWRSRGGPG